MASSEMKAVVFHEFGGPEVLLYEEIERPRPGPGEALLKIGATTLNRGPDLMAREGRFGSRHGFNLPHVGGSDAAGEVVELGDGIAGQDLRVGSRAVLYSILFCGRCDLCRSGRGEQLCRRLRLFGVETWGGNAEYAVVPARNLIPLPDSVSYEQASCLSITYLTAWHSLVTRGRVGPGDTVLVMAAGSGIGAAAIQICRLLGARVFATSSEGWKRERAVEIGAEACFDYREPEWPEQFLAAAGDQGASVLFDNVMGAGLEQSLRCLGRGGRLCCSGATAGYLVSLDLRRLYRDQISCEFSAQGPMRELELLVDLVDRGELDPVIDSRYPLSECRQAHERLATASQFGKVVLLPDPV